jgi:hypothetical protein
MHDGVDVVGREHLVESLLVADVDPMEREVAPDQLAHAFERDGRTVRQVVDDDDRPARLQQHDRSVAPDVAGASGEKRGTRHRRIIARGCVAQRFDVESRREEALLRL